MIKARRFERTTCLQHRLRVEDPREPEIGHLHKRRSITGQEYVLRLQVTMHHAHAMHVLRKHVRERYDSWNTMTYRERVAYLICELLSFEFDCVESGEYGHALGKNRIIQRLLTSL